MTLKADGVINIYYNKLSYKSREQMISRSFVEAVLVDVAFKII